MKIGVWLPIQLVESHSTEGILRMVMGMIRGLHELGHSVVIATPRSSVPALRHILSESELKEGPNLEILSGPSLEKSEKNEGKLGKVRHAQVVANRKLQEARGRMAPGAIKAAVKQRGPVAGLRRVFRGSFEMVSWRLVRLGLRLGKAGLSLGTNSDRRIAALARKCRGRQDIECWYSPNPFWDSATLLDGPLVAGLWDLIYTEHPFSFPVADLDAKVRRTTGKAQVFVTMTDTIRDRHGLGYLKLDPERVITAIPGNIDHARAANGSGSSREAATRAIQEYLRATYTKPARPNGYLCDFPLGDVPYLFYASRIRPYKNVFNLLRAYDLLRWRGSPLKLVFTCSVERESEAGRFMSKAGLWPDVLQIENVPEKIFGSFFAAAELTVVPSLFEGGMPLNFQESLSMNTPVALGRIPTVQEFIRPGDPLDRFLFSPHHPEDMADKMELCLRERDVLLKQQKELLASKLTRSWREYASTHLEAFERARRLSLERQ